MGMAEGRVAYPASEAVVGSGEASGGVDGVGSEAGQLGPVGLVPSGAVRSSLEAPERAQYDV